MSIIDLITQILGNLKSQSTKEMVDHCSEEFEPTESFEPASFGPIDKREADILAKLYPPFAEKVLPVLERARTEGFSIYIFEGMRTIERQAELYAKGRDIKGNVINKKLVVTNALPGTSFHNYGLAVDLVFKVDGEWSWDSKLPWKRIGEISREIGLEWAGTWLKFSEMPHHQISLPYITWRDLKKWYDLNGLANVWKEVGTRI